MAFQKRDEKEIRRINRMQQERFDTLVDVFEPPLPEGVPERLAQITAAAGICEGDTVLDVGAGTGILVPDLQRYRPGRILACDLSEKMLQRLRRNHPGVETCLGDVCDLLLPTKSIDAVLVNACYPNIADKAGAFANLSRMLKPAGRLVISHPLGRRFVETLRTSSPFPLDALPHRSAAERMLAPFGFEIRSYTDQPGLFLLSAARRGGGLRCKTGRSA